MKMCQPHWDELREAIRVRGLGHLVSKSGKVAMDRQVKELEGRGETEDFDPLMAANTAIWTRALNAGGLYMMGQDENGNELCPLCELNKHARNPDGSEPDPKASTQWINGCADFQKQTAVEKGLIGKES